MPVNQEYNEEEASAPPRVTYTKPEWRSTTEDGIDIYVQYELTRERTIEVGNRKPGYDRVVNRQQLYFVKLQGLKERGEALEPLLARIRERNTQRVDVEQTVINLAYGLKVGLSEACIRHFCLDNEIDPQSSMTRAALRKLVLNRRNMNAQQYGRGLKKVGIVIGANRKSGQPDKT